MAMVFSVFKNFSPFIFETYSNMTHSKNQILDPITTAIRIGLLKYKPTYTKLSLSHNRIYLQEPWIFQGTIRRMYGDHRSDINILIQCIARLLIWYNVNNKQIQYICNQMVSGLHKLLKCYQDTDDNLVSQALTFFIHKIEHEMETARSTDKKKILTDIEENNKDQQEYFRNHWNSSEINLIYNLLRELEIDDRDGKQASIIRSIEDIISYKDEETHKYVTKLVKY